MAEISLNPGIKASDVLPCQDICKHSGDNISIPHWDRAGLWKIGRVIAHNARRQTIIWTNDA